MSYRSTRVRGSKSVGHDGGQGGQLNMVNGNLNMVNGNLAELLAQRASEAGWYDKPAYYAPDVVTHGQIHDGGARLGEVLRNRGLSSGDRVLLCLPDSPELVQLLLACLARGIMAFLANPEPPSRRPRVSGARHGAGACRHIWSSARSVSALGRCGSRRARVRCDASRAGRLRTRQQ